MADHRDYAGAGSADRRKSRANACIVAGRNLSPVSQKLLDPGPSANRDEISTTAEADAGCHGPGHLTLRPHRHGDNVPDDKLFPKFTGRPGSLGQRSLLPGELGSGGVSWLGTNSSLRLNVQRPPHSSVEWASIGQSGRTAAIYRELRAIDMRTAERQWKTVETARRHVREGEQRVARQEGLLTGMRKSGGKDHRRAESHWR